MIPASSRLSRARWAAGFLLAGFAILASASAAQAPVQVRMCFDEDPIVPRLAESLGYLKDEGVEIVRVKAEDFSGEDYLIQGPLNKGQVDAAYHWFHHTVFGARHHLPIQAVMLVNDAPAIKIFVANRVKDQIRSAADFKGRNVAEGAGYGTKSLLTHYLAQKAGLPPDSYTPVMLEVEGRQARVVEGLREGRVDVMAFQEPITSAIEETHLATVLYDLNQKETTEKALGAIWPSQCVLMAPKFIKENPDTVQRLVNAFVRAMRFVNSHDADEIAAHLPAGYFEGKDRAAEMQLLRQSLPTFAKGDYSIPPAGARLEVEVIQGSPFDSSEEGRWRATSEISKVNSDDLYTNAFVEQAMKRYP